MLTRLTVSNLAIIDKAEVDFSQGLNVLTGKTGSGKSVIMGAIGLALGGRCDASALRDGEKESRIEAVFRIDSKNLEIKSILNEAGLPECEDSELIVRRILTGSGSSKVWVNDARTTLSTLKALGAELADIHGARANQNLLTESFQRRAVDQSGKVECSKYAAAWDNLCSVKAEIDSLLESVGSEDELDMLRYQVSELESASITEDDEDIASRHAAAAHAGEILEAGSELTEALGGDRGICEQLSRLQPKFASLVRYFPEAESWAAEAEDAVVKVQELSRTIADAMSKIDVDPSELDDLDSRLGVLNKLKRKYLKGAENTIAALMNVLESKRARLDAIEGFDEKLSALRAKEKAALEFVEKEGELLLAARTAAASKLSRLVTHQLRDLGFLKAKFYVAIESASPKADGCDSVCYMFEPNPGESAKPLASIASSGEIARVMLALKSVLALNDGAETVVFDEIDANIGGEVASTVGEKLRAVGERRQVIAITHQPQSAVYAGNHLVVSKSVVAGRTIASVKRVDQSDRVREIARMLGGESSMPIVGEHAAELLARAGNML